jgi:hypothetical protein
MLVQQFKWVMRPEVHRPEINGIFPDRARFSSHVPETALERVYTPLLEYLYVKAVPIRRLQSGQLPMYILYIFVTLIVLMVVDIG